VADRVDHQLERGVDDRASFFRVKVLLELGRALDVGEQRRDRLAFAFEILGGRRVGDPNPRVVGFPRRRDRRAERDASILTELGRRRVVRAAPPASIGQRTAACGQNFLPEVLSVPHLEQRTLIAQFV
jgi:hypothetical protein